VRQALEGAGIELLDGDPGRADLVVIGWDRSVDYTKLRTAALLVQRGARLVATNADPSYPAPDGLWPGAGALLAAVTTTTGAGATVVGKPARPLFEAAAEVTGATRPLVVGDRLDTDVAGAGAMGWDSLLVLSGAATPPELLRAPFLPTYVGKDLSFLSQAPPPARFRPARAEELEPVGELLESAGLSAAGLDDRLSGTMVCQDGDHPGAEDGGHALAATACLQPLENAAILRSVAVRKDLRGSGLGMLVVAAAVRLAGERGIPLVGLFTEEAEGFFEKLGFRRVERSALPDSIRTSPHAAEECAQSAAAMVFELGGWSEADPPAPQV
jgi:N-acetylglutamate synthase-like GNAT family acetyltransferase